MHAIHYRKIIDTDYPTIISKLNDWWGGRQMTDMLPRLFFIHFQSTSFIAESNGDIVGFLIGFYSQTYSNEAYVHFIGVKPNARKQKIGEKLYHLFFEQAATDGVCFVKCVTSPANKVSIAFHQKIGFELEDGNNRTSEDIPFTSNYDGAGQDRVLFKIAL